MKFVLPNNSKDIFSRNILFHNEILIISEKCSQQNIKLVLLKGAAMIELFPEYSFVREMEDIDVLVEKKVYKKFKNLLIKLGYEEVLYDPNAMFNKEKNVQIDIETRLWYLSEQDNIKVINSAIKLQYEHSFSNFYVLKPQDMLHYTYVHSYVHHAKLEPKWQQDISLLKEKFGLQEMEPKFKVKYNFFLNNNIIYKGYVLRFLFLPFKQKIIYLFETLFPSTEFVLLRYGIKKKIYSSKTKYFFILGYLYVRRWVILILKFSKFFNNILKTLFLTKSLAHT